MDKRSCALLLPQGAVPGLGLSLPQTPAGGAGGTRGWSCAPQLGAGPQLCFCFYK